MQMKLLDYKKIQTNVDRVIAHFAYIYDFNFAFRYLDGEIPNFFLNT